MTGDKIKHWITTAHSAYRNLSRGHGTHCIAHY
jgi:hypothetical protein